MIPGPLSSFARGVFGASRASSSAERGDGPAGGLNCAVPFAECRPWSDTG